jgi:hypothetical protein
MVRVFTKAGGGVQLFLNPIPGNGQVVEKPGVVSH